MSERFRLPLPEKIPTGFSPAILVLVGATLAWALLSSGKQPEGCYRVDADHFLAIADNEVRIVSKAVTPEQQTRIPIKEADRTRGWVLTLGKRLVYDPDSPFGIIRTKEASASEGTMTLVINELHGESPYAFVRRDNGEVVKFFEFACDARAIDPEAAR